jgi:hypothetical protein
VVVVVVALSSTKEAPSPSVPIPLLLVEVEVVPMETVLTAQDLDLRPLVVEQVPSLATAARLLVVDLVVVVVVVVQYLATPLRCPQTRVELFSQRLQVEVMEMLAEPQFWLVSTDLEVAVVVREERVLALPLVRESLVLR